MSRHVLTFLALLAFALPAFGQDGDASSSAGEPAVSAEASETSEALDELLLEASGFSTVLDGELLGGPGSITDASGSSGDASEAGRFSTAIEIALLLTALSMVPAALITVTSFTRIVIVLSFVRRSLSTNELPPNPVIIGLSLFLTSFVMSPVLSRMYETAYVPYQAQEKSGQEAAADAWVELRAFLLANTRESELELFASMMEIGAEDDPSLVMDDSMQPSTDELPFRVVIPAFILSELKTAFQMGFLLFLPFLVIDLVIASVLISMGMFMLPPVMISTPFKILLFVLVDGWHLVCESLVTSFVVT